VNECKPLVLGTLVADDAAATDEDEASHVAALKEDAESKAAGLAENETAASDAAALEEDETSAKVDALKPKDGRAYNSLPLNLLQPSNRSIRQPTRASCGHLFQGQQGRWAFPNLSLFAARCYRYANGNWNRRTTCV